jgi:hypothetical protein
MAGKGGFGLACRLESGMLPLRTMICNSSVYRCLAAACLVLAGCVAPKADVVEEPKPKTVPKTTAEAPAEIKPPDSPLRIGNMLGLPKESEFRATNPGAANPEPGGSAVIVSPTTKPANPPKPAPKE